MFEFYPKDQTFAFNDFNSTEFARVNAKKNIEALKFAIKRIETSADIDENMIFLKKDPFTKIFNL